MTNLTSMYYWQDRAEWMVLEALQCARQQDSGGWAGIIPAWDWWQTLCQGVDYGPRGLGMTSFVRQLEKLRGMGGAESRQIPAAPGQKSRGGKLTEWRLSSGLKIGLYGPDMTEAGIRWIET